MTSRLLQAAVGIASAAYVDAKYGVANDVKLAVASGRGERE
jgi:hypothetical protein